MLNEVSQFFLQNQSNNNAIKIYILTFFYNVNNLLQAVYQPLKPF